VVQVDTKQLTLAYQTERTSYGYGNTESAAMEALRKMYRSWDNFVILSIEWK
jgi:hypothetical protein